MIPSVTATTKKVHPAQSTTNAGKRRTKKVERKRGKEGGRQKHSGWTSAQQSWRNKWKIRCDNDTSRNRTFPYITKDLSSSGARSLSSSSVSLVCLATVLSAWLPGSAPRPLLPAVSACGRISHWRPPALTGMRSIGSKSSSTPFANRSASLFPSRGVQ